MVMHLPESCERPSVTFGNTRMVGLPKCPSRCKGLFMMLIQAFILISVEIKAQKVDQFPLRTDPLWKRVETFTALTLGNHWNEGTIMWHVIFPPAGHERPIIGAQADLLDATSEMLAAYSYRFAITDDPEDQQMADRIFEGILKLERVTGEPGLVARAFNRTDTALWHEEALWFHEWHASETMPGYRWLGDLSVDKFTSLLFGVGIYWEICADSLQREKAEALVDRFVGRVVDHNYKLVDPDGKMTLWGNFCPNLPHQPLNSLLMLMGLKVAYQMTGIERFHAAYHMLIDRYQYDDHQIHSKVIWPPEWRLVGDDYHATRALYMLMRYEEDPDLLNKYRMNLNRHWFVWKDMEYTWESSIWYVMAYQVLTGEQVVKGRFEQIIRDMWGFERQSREWKIPTSDGYKLVESEHERSASAMIRNYWFGRYHQIIDPKW